MFYNTVIMIVVGTPETAWRDPSEIQLSRNGITNAQLMGKNLRSMDKLTAKTAILFGTSVEAAQAATIIALSFPDTLTMRSLTIFNKAILESRKQEHGTIAGYRAYGKMLAREMGRVESLHETDGNLIVVGNAEIVKSLYAAAAGPHFVNEITGTSLVPDDFTTLQPGWAVEVTPDPLAITDSYFLLRK